MLIRRILEKNNAAHQGTWNKDAKGSFELRGKTMGIIGYGKKQQLYADIRRTQRKRDHPNSKGVIPDVNETTDPKNLHRNACRILSRIPGN